MDGVQMISVAQMSPAAGDMYALSAGLDAVSGVFGYLASLNNFDIAQSRAQMIMNAAYADARRYGEQADANLALMKAGYLASGVTLSGSPIDALDKQAQISKENENSIIMSGETEAMDQTQQGYNALTAGRNALLGGITSASNALNKGFAPTIPVAGGGTGFGGTPLPASILADGVTA